ncbi:MAG: glycosyltransferase family 39 protein [Acidobacteriota bacterium]|nr:glycosyltransferase family 39 protein [Acidobacteriota bacterium]
MTLAKRGWLLLFLVATAFYLYGLGRLPLVGPDEPRYAQVAREMFLRGDLITPTLGGHTWFEKPASLYWMMIASFRVFGVSEWSARLGPALAGLLTIVALGWISHLVERKQGSVAGNFSFFSALVIASSGGLIVFSRASSFDIVITMTITWALGFFLASEIEEQRRNWFLAGFYCLVGLSLLAKGLVGIVLPLGVIGAFYLLRRKFPDRTVLISLVWGMPLALGVALVWYGPVIARHGWLFIDQFFIQHHFARYFSNKYQHPQPLYFYLPVILMLSVPWTFFLIDALFKAKGWRWTTTEPADKTRVFALAWFLVPILFFSFSESKLPAYVLPSLPAAALLAGDRLRDYVSGKANTDWTMRLTAAMFLLLAAAGMIYAHQTGRVSLQCALLVLGPVVLAAVLILITSRKRLMAALLVAAVPAVGVVLTLSCAADWFASRESVRELIRQADIQGYGAAPVFMLSRIERSSEFYAAGRVVYDPDGDPHKFETGEEVVTEARKTNRPLLIIAPLGSMWRVQDLPGLRTSIIANNGRVAVMAVTAQ